MSPAPQAISQIVLNDGRALAQLGFGTAAIAPASTTRVVSAALEAGYRHLDTAQMYGNEQGVGRAVAAADVPREQIWVTTKLGNDVHERSAARQATERSLAHLGGRIDLYLVHWPLAMYDDVAHIWEVMQEIKDDYPIGSIGVSNFTAAHLTRLADAGHLPPTVNQIESNPYFVNEELHEICADHGITVQASSPLARGAVLVDPQLRALADQLDRTVAQVVLRWGLQRGDVVVAKTSTPQRMADNLDVVDFTLTPEQMASISALHTGTRTGPDPDLFDRLT